MAGHFEALEHLRRALDAAETTDDLLLVAEISHSIDLVSQAIFKRQARCVRAAPAHLSEAADRLSSRTR